MINMADNVPNQSSASSGAPQRSPVEKFLVRGVILVMLVVVGRQGMAWWGFSQTTSPLLAAVKAADDGNDELTAKEVEPMIKGSPIYAKWTKKDGKWTQQEGATINEEEAMLPSVHDTASRLDSYTWKGWLKSYTIRLYYGVGDDPVVINTDNGDPSAAEPPKSEPSPDTATTDNGAESAAPAAGSSSAAPPSDAPAKKDVEKDEKKEGDSSAAPKESKSN